MAKKKIKRVANQSHWDLLNFFLFTGRDHNAFNDVDCAIQKVLFFDSPRKNE